MAHPHNIISIASLHKNSARNITICLFITQTFQVNGLTIPSRESYLSLLNEALNKNLTSTKDIDEDYNQHLSRQDVEQCAVELEYEAFSSSTVVSLYRRAMTKAVNILVKR